MKRIERSRRRALESADEERKIRVVETEFNIVSIQSTIEHEKFGGKAGGPSPKAKYDLMTDRV